jgi:hypothetical protein
MGVGASHAGAKVLGKAFELIKVVGEGESDQQEMGADDLV